MGSTELTEVLADSPEPAEAVMAAMERYVQELLDGNVRFGLIAGEDTVHRDRLFSRHIMDSLAPWRIVSAVARESGRRRLYDLGSGAGLPGIPLALILGRYLEETVLVERRTKRVSFLRGAVPLVLSAYRQAAKSPDGGIGPVPGIRVCESDADQLAVVEGNRLDGACIVFRAFRRTTEDTLAALGRVFPPGTPVCAFKGRMEQTEGEAAVIADSKWAGGSGAEGGPRIIPVEVPGLEAERSLLVWYTKRRDAV